MSSISRRSRSVATPSPGSLILGWNGPETGGFGFNAATPQPRSTTEEPLWYDGDGHLITLAPTRAGKGRGVLVPNLLLYPGPAVVFDPKGELYRVTARRRRDLGQRVVRVDPCGVAGPADEADAFNPFDIFALANADLETDAQTLAEWLSGPGSLKEPFWDQHGRGLVSGLIAHAASGRPEEQRNMETVRKLLMCDDPIYQLAVMLDTEGKKMNKMAYEEVASFLAITDITRSGILSTALSYIKPFLSPRMSSAMRNSTFPIAEVVSGDPVTIYLILPPDKFRSHRAMLKMWIGTLLKAITSRTRIPDLRTLFLLDECAQLEHFPYLETIITLCAGYGVRCWTFWQDLEQLQSCYPGSWQTILNNSDVIQTFGIRNRHMATQWGNYLEHGVETLMKLAPVNQVVKANGRGEFCCRRPDYLGDPLFSGLYDENPFHQQATKPVATGR